MLNAIICIYRTLHILQTFNITLAFCLRNVKYFKEMQNILITIWMKYKLLNLELRIGYGLVRSQFIKPFYCEHASISRIQSGDTLVEGVLCVMCKPPLWQGTQVQDVTLVTHLLLTTLILQYMMLLYIVRCGLSCHGNKVWPRLPW